MVLNMADFGKSGNRPKLLKNVAKMLANGFLTTCEIVREVFGRICNDTKSADFDQKAWAIAHGFEHGGFWQLREIDPNSLKTSQICFQMDF